MAEKPKLESPRIRVVMEDGSEHRVQAYNRDMLAWDRTRVRRKWPEAQEATWVFLNFVAWNALTREGQIPKMTLDEFENTALEVRPINDDDDDEEDSVGPTQEGAEPSS